MMIMLWLVMTTTMILVVEDVTIMFRLTPMENDEHDAAAEDDDKIGVTEVVFDIKCSEVCLWIL